MECETLLHTFLLIFKEEESTPIFSIAQCLGTLF